MRLEHGPGTGGCQPLAARQARWQGVLQRVCRRLDYSRRRTQDPMPMPRNVQMQSEVLSPHGATMPERVVPAAAHQQASGSDTPMTPHSEFLFRLAERFGVPTVLCLLVLWWAKNGIVQPLMDAHFSFIDKIVTSQDRHTDAIGALGDKLDTLIQVSRNAAQEKTPD